MDVIHNILSNYKYDLNKQNEISFLKDKQKSDHFYETIHRATYMYQNLKKLKYKRKSFSKNIIHMSSDKMYKIEISGAMVDLYGRWDF